MYSLVLSGPDAQTAGLYLNNRQVADFRDLDRIGLTLENMVGYRQSSLKNAHFQVMGYYAKRGKK